MQVEPDQGKKQFARRVFLLCLATTTFGMYVGSEAKAGHNIIGANSDLSGALFFTYGSIGMIFSLEDQFINALYKNRWLQLDVLFILVFGISELQFFEEQFVVSYRNLPLLSWKGAAIFLGHTGLFLYVLFRIIRKLKKPNRED